MDDFIASLHVISSMNIIMYNIKVVLTVLQGVMRICHRPEGGWVPMANAHNALGNSL